MCIKARGEEPEEEGGADEQTQGGEGRAQMSLSSECSAGQGRGHG